jgi:hypothetical protein
MQEVGVSSQDLMDGPVQGMRRWFDDSSLKLVLFGTHTKQRLGHMLRVPVRVKLLLSFQPHWIFVVTRIGRGIKSGEQRRRRRHPRGNAEFSVSGNHG